MTTEARGWKLRVHNGSGDTELSVEFCKTPFAGVHKIETVDELKEPELWNPEGVLVTRGTDNVRQYLLLAHQAQSC